jgi:hypothetical protein
MNTSEWNVAKIAIKQKKGLLSGFRTFANLRVVPLAGLEPALLAEPDFESGVSTNSTIEAQHFDAGNRLIHRRRWAGQWFSFTLGVC